MFRQARCCLSSRDVSWVLSAPSRRCVSQLNNGSDFQKLDVKWQQKWVDTGRRRRRDTSQKSYILPMFAYPSGSLHMGHLRVYTISDVIARHRRMKGHNVLHPTGWDAFGLPAENAAIERGIDPGEWTVTNIEKMKKQLRSMNTDFDWDAEISTCSPQFYKHTQKLFLMLYERGLAYQADAMVNWDPVDKTVLANEQVDGNGRSWRSGAIVQQKMLRQWFFRITEFQEDLLNDLDALSKDNNWPERVITQQRNWIGRSNGARIKFAVETSQNNLHAVSVFTTRPDTLLGVKYLAVSLSHPLVTQLAPRIPELQAFIDRRATYGPESKDGFQLPVRAVKPIQQSTQSTVETIPIFVAPYVLEGYGEGAVMGVPGHDSRDLAFWKQHRPDDTVPIVVANERTSEGLEPRATDLAEAFTAKGFLTGLCGRYAGLDSDEASRQIITDLSQQGKAESAKTWRLRDWLVSRQRYWGAPIPIIHCASCGSCPVPEKDLPVMLPKLDSSVKGQAGNPLDSCDDWVNTTCPSCGSAAKRETDTMDTFVDSSWYYMRFPDSDNSKEMFSAASAASKLPVDTYIGGVEHAILHLLYARFIYKFLCREGLVKIQHPVAEPFTQLIAQGMVHGKTYSDPDTGRFLLPQELDHSPNQPIIKTSGKQPSVSFEKMSKSKHNGVDPSTCITKYGADATRAHILFAAPVSEVLQWDEEKIVGIQRWFLKVNRLVSDFQDISGPMSLRDLMKISEADAEILLLTQSTLSSVTNTLENNIYSLNTYVSDLIKLTNGLSDKGVRNLSPSVATECVSTLIQVMAPLAPAFAEECWEELQLSTGNEIISGQGDDTSVFDSQWPTQILSDEEKLNLELRRNSQVCAVQINGKLKFTTEVPLPSGMDAKVARSKEHEEAIIAAVLASSVGHEWLKVKNNWDLKKRVIVVNGGKVLNVVF